MARAGRAVANQLRLSRVLWLLLVVFGVTVLAYFVVPAASLRVVGIASDPTERFLLRTLAAALPPGLRAAAVTRRCTDLDVPAIHPSLVPNHKNYKSWCWIKIACVRQFTNSARMLPSCSRRLTPAMCSSHIIPPRRTKATRWR